MTTSIYETAYGVFADSLFDRDEPSDSVGATPPEEGIRQRCEVFACAVGVFHHLGITQLLAIGLKARYKIGYRRFYESLIAFDADNPRSLIHKLVSGMAGFYSEMREGRTPELVDARYGSISWPPEEYFFLQAVSRKRELYEEIERFAVGLAGPLDAYLDDLLWLQECSLKVPDCGGLVPTADLQVMKYDLPEIVRRAADGGEVDAAPGHFVYRLEAHGPYADTGDYARRCVWYGRKGGNMLRKATRSPITSLFRANKEVLAS